MKQELVKDWMTEDVVTIRATTMLPEAHELMKAAKVRRLPVVENNGRLIGILTLSDIHKAQPSAATTLSIWELNYMLAALKVKRIMTPDPITITPNHTIGDAARLMLENRIGGLPVVDEAGELVGIITESDIFSMVVLHEWEVVGRAIAS